jgi:hypothetical protein
MVYPFAASRILLAQRTNPWTDSASSPVLPAGVARLSRGMNAAGFGGDGEITGQSYETGAHPPR